MQGQALTALPWCNYFNLVMFAQDRLPPGGNGHEFAIDCSCDLGITVAQIPAELGKCGGLRLLFVTVDSDLHGSSPQSCMHIVIPQPISRGYPRI